MANKILYAPEAALSFNDSGGDATLTLQNLAAGAGRMSARYDRGAGSKPAWALVRGVFQFESAPALGEVVEVYLSTSDGTYADGVVATTDGALTADQLRNLRAPVLLVQAQSTSTATNNIASEWVFIPTQYFSVGVFNRSAGDNLENTANASRVLVTFYSQEVQ